MTRAHKSLVALVALAASAFAAGPSKAVLALREAPARCNVTDEPKRFMVFTRQRSGSRWFVDTISALGDGRRFVEPHIRELSLNGTPFHTRFVAAAADTGYDANACASREPSPACSCLLRGVYAASARIHKNAGKAIGFKFMVHTDPPKARNNYDKFARLEALAASVCALDIPFVVMLRHNVLRRQISKLTAHLGASSHATTREEVAQIRRIRPVVPVEGLPERLAYEVVQNEALVNLLHRHCGTERAKHALFAYEDTSSTAPCRSGVLSRITTRSPARCGRRSLSGCWSSLFAEP